MKGRAEGMVEGEANKAYEIAKSMLDNGFQHEFVAKLTGLTLEQVKKLVKKNRCDRE